MGKGFFSVSVDFLRDLMNLPLDVQITGIVQSDFDKRQRTVDVFVEHEDIPERVNPKTNEHLVVHLAPEFHSVHQSIFYFKGWKYEDHEWDFIERKKEESE